MLIAVPFTVAAGAVTVTAVPGPVPLGALLSAALAGYVTVLVYESRTARTLHPGAASGSR